MREHSAVSVFIDHLWPVVESSSLVYKIGVANVFTTYITVLFSIITDVDLSFLSVLMGIMSPNIGLKKTSQSLH